MKKFAFHFTYATMIASMLLAGFSSYVMWVLFKITDNDHATYQELVAAANPTNTRGQPSPYVATQKRKKVQKDVLFFQGDERLQLRLNSAESDIILDHQTEKTELMEKMRDVTCFIQYELFYQLPDGRVALKQANGKLLVKEGDPNDPEAWFEINGSDVKAMQQLRYIEAREAVYHYKSEMLFAENVFMARYIIPGHKLVSSVKEYKPIATATAENIAFSLAGKESNFKATKIKSVLYNGEKPL